MSSILNVIYFLHQPSLIAMLDGEVESDEQFLKRSVFICPEKVSNGIVHAKVFSCHTQDFFHCDYQEKMFTCSAVADQALFDEINQWAVAHSWRIVVDEKMFDTELSETMGQ